MAGKQQVESLTYSVRSRVVLKYFGILCLAFGAFSALILVVSLLAGDLPFSLRAGLVVIALAGVGFPLGRIRAPEGIQVNESLVVTALVFLVASLAMSFPLMSPEVSFPDALFESVSAITTTGLSATGSVRGKSAAFLFTRAWLQWIGGLGIMVLSAAVLFHPGMAARRISRSDMETEDLVGGTRANARIILRVYLLLTIAGVAVLALQGVDIFPALLHTLAGVSTGGFSSYDESLTGLGGFSVQAMIMFVSLLGAIPLALYFRAFRKGWRELAGDVEVRALLCLGVLFSCLAALSLWASGTLPWWESLRNGPLLAFSAQTTTGFTSISVPALDPVTKLLLVLAMAVGGGVGSTAGGVKVIRLLILLRMTKMIVDRTHLPPHAIAGPRLGGHTLASEDIERALLLILLFVGLVILSWIPFVASGYDPLDSLFDVMSAAATVGLSTGVAGPGLPPFLKGVLCLDMLLGRLEIVAFLVLFSPRTWIGRRAKSP